MPDVSFVNQTPGSWTFWWVTWKMVRTAIDAGWTIRACGNGTSFSTAGPITPGSGTDYWNTLPSGSGAWLCMRHPTLAFEMIFWRDTTSNHAGKVIVAINNGFTAAGFASCTASSPGTIPAAGQYLIGTSSVTGYFMGTNSDVPWRTHIIAKSDGSFAAWSMRLGYFWSGCFGFSMTDPVADEAADPWNFIFMCALGTSIIAYETDKTWLTGDAAAAQPFAGIASDGVLRAYSIVEGYTVPIATAIIATGDDLSSDGTTYMAHKVYHTNPVGFTGFSERKGIPRMWRAINANSVPGTILYEGGVPAWVTIGNADTFAMRWDDTTTSYISW